MPATTWRTSRALALARQIDSPHASARIEAAHALRELGPDPTALLLHVYMRSRAARSTSARRAAALAWPARCGVLAWLLACAGGAGAFAPLAALVAVVPLLALPILAMAARQRSRDHAAIALALAHVGDRRCAGVLAHHLRDPGHRDAGRMALAVALRLHEIGAADGDLLRAADRRALHARLSLYASWAHLDPGCATLCTAALGALARLGDPRCARTARWIAEMEVRTAGEAGLRSAALDYLAAVRVSEERSRAPRTLVRAASRDPRSELVRAVPCRPDATKEMLVRPAVG